MQSKANQLSQQWLKKGTSEGGETYRGASVKE